MKLFQIIVLAIVLNIFYHLTLNAFNNQSFKVFNYKVTVHKCGIKISDRITKIEKKQARKK